MFQDTPAFSSFSVNDLAKAKDFYAHSLGLRVTEESKYSTLLLHLAGDAEVMIYPKGQDHQPATFTVLNFVVDDIEHTVDQLADKGVTFEQYDFMNTNEKGISSMPGGPSMAWFKDPAGNILAVMEKPKK